MTLRDRLLPNESLDMGAVLARLADLEARVARQTSAPLGGQPPSRHEIVYRPTSAHGFQAGHVVTFNGTDWILANATTVTDASVLGYVLQVRNSKEARIVLWGIADLTQYPLAIAVTPSTWSDYTDYYLTGSGLLTATKPTSNVRLVLRTYANKVAQIAPPSSATTTASDLIVITGGNILATAVGSWAQQTGIKAVNATLVNVPTTAPNTTTHTYLDGLGHGTLQNPDGTSTTVWVTNRFLPGFSGRTFPLISLTTKSGVLSVRKSTSIPVVAGGTTTVYMPFST